MKRICFIVILIILLTACYPRFMPPIFNGNRTGDESCLIMDYSIFDTTDNQKLVINEGDIIHVDIVVDDGDLSYDIKNESGEVIVKDKVSISTQFDLMIDKSGIYTITVTGNKTKGSVKFIVERNE